MQLDFPFLQLVFTGFISLFPAVNPVGSAFIVDPLLSGLNHAERKAASKRIAFYCFLICTVSILIGTYIMELFGISIPIVLTFRALLVLVRIFGRHGCIVPRATSVATWRRPCPWRSGLARSPVNGSWCPVVGCHACGELAGAT